MSRPNVLLILADDMGYGDFGAFSDGSARTPALDQLVSQSALLTQHYSESPVCTPARAGLLTGVTITGLVRLTCASCEDSRD
jgi:arylsulfatase A